MESRRQKAEVAKARQPWNFVIWVSPSFCMTLVHFLFVYCYSVAQSCPTLFHPMDRCTPGLPVHHQLLELAQTQVHWVSDAIQPCHPLLPPSPFAFNLSQHHSLFKWVVLCIRWPKYWSFSSASVLPMNIQDWFPLGWTGLISLLSRDSQESYPTPQFKSINSLVLSFLYSPTLTSIYNYWKNHSFDQTDLCWQSNVSAF